MVPAKVWGYGRPIATGTAVCDWKNNGFLSSTHLELCVSVFGYSGESLRLGYADKLYGDYVSVEDVIDTAQHIPSLGKSRAIVSLDAASVVSCSLTERSAEEETPITRAVSVPLCVCVRKLRSLLIYGILCIYKGCDHSIRKGRRISKGDTRNTVESTGQ